MQHTFFTFLFRCCCIVKLPHYTFYGKIVVFAHKKNFVACIPFCFFSSAALFSPCWLIAFLIFSPPLQNVNVAPPTKFVYFVFFYRLL